MILTEKLLYDMFPLIYRKGHEFIEYLLEKYGEEPYPYEYTEQDLYEQIRKEL